jgi:hypothetical protein
VHRVADLKTMGRSGSNPRCNILNGLNCDEGGALFRDNLAPLYRASEVVVDRRRRVESAMFDRPEKVVGPRLGSNESISTIPPILLERQVDFIPEPESRLFAFYDPLALGMNYLLRGAAVERRLDD